ncbi:ATP synthase subunit delta mitochondrial [Fasciola gigantica]|uniref:F-ATPase delta subunit n=1 Tax=Fasciola gigantica TaxID=46835 RepID=A0A504YW06_FASGI|nr:ATP synthase subunit delta mitochondrial [Fasciola gigantica]
MANFKSSLVGSLLRASRQLSTSAGLRADLSLTFASTGRVFYENKVVRQVDVPTLTGRFGILAEHVPTIGCLKPGVVTVTEEDGSVKNYFVSSGIVTVNGDSTVQLLAEEAATLDQLDAGAIREGLARANSDLVAAQSDAAKAEAQIAAEAYEELSRAVENRS